MNTKHFWAIVIATGVACVAIAFGIAWCVIRVLEWMEWV